jgi:hypothetical protein
MCQRFFCFNRACCQHYLTWITDCLTDAVPTSSMDYGVFLFFAGWMMLMTVYVAMLLPETKGVPVEDIMSRWTTCVTPAQCYC